MKLTVTRLEDDISEEYTLELNPQSYKDMMLKEGESKEFALISLPPATDDEPPLVSLKHLPHDEYIRIFEEYHIRPRNLEVWDGIYTTWITLDEDESICLLDCVRIKNKENRNETRIH